MKDSMSIYLASKIGVFVLVSLGFLFFANGQVAVEDMEWKWREDAANPLYSLNFVSKEYAVSMTSRAMEDRRLIEFSILRENRVAYSWVGHVHTVFCSVGDILYFVDFQTDASGGRAVAVNLATGKELWRTPLQAIGAVRHSSYSNLINIAANEQVVTIYGNESLGKYLEIMDARTGNSIDHKLHR